jgi:hypothetical protein
LPDTHSESFAVQFSERFSVADFRVPDASSERKPKSFSGRTAFASADFALTEPV